MFITRTGTKQTQKNKNKTIIEGVGRVVGRVVEVGVGSITEQNQRRSKRNKRKRRNRERDNEEGWVVVKGIKGTEEIRDKYANIL